MTGSRHTSSSDSSDKKEPDSPTPSMSQAAARTDLSLDQPHRRRNSKDAERRLIVNREEEKRWMNPSVRSLCSSPLGESSSVRCNVHTVRLPPTHESKKACIKRRRGALQDQPHRRRNSKDAERRLIVNREEEKRWMNPSVRSLCSSPLGESSRSRKDEIRQKESDGSLEDRPLIIDEDWGRVPNSPVSQDEKEEETVPSEELPKESTIVQEEKKQEWAIPVVFPQRSISYPVESDDDYDTESDTEALNPQRRAQSCNQITSH
nr:hypothetical transcript [Hymenolepis microstoma]